VPDEMQKVIGRIENNFDSAETGAFQVGVAG
jgi:hypothetical protein